MSLLLDVQWSRDVRWLMWIVGSLQVLSVDNWHKFFASVPEFLDNESRQCSYIASMQCTI